MYVHDCLTLEVTGAAEAAPWAANAFGSSTLFWRKAPDKVQDEDAAITDAAKAFSIISACVRRLVDAVVRHIFPWIL